MTATTISDLDMTIAGVDHTSSQANKVTIPRHFPPAGDQLPESIPGAPTNVQLTQDSTWNGSATVIVDSNPSEASSLADPFLALAADMLDDTERTRIANENRLRQLTRSEADSDGEERGFGLDLSHPDVARVAALVDALKKIEHDATLNLNRRLRKHPLGPWIKAQKGIGEKQAARLLAVVGDPYWHDAQDRPRLVSELWSYCGHGDAKRRIRKGMTQGDLLACGSPVAKMRIHLIAEACLKAQGPYADVYYGRKEATKGRLHAVECRRCGPAGHPALPGSPWPPAHRHADALRITAKEILRDLWTEARRLHTSPSSAPNLPRDG